MNFERVMFYKKAKYVNLEFLKRLTVIVLYEI